MQADPPSRPRPSLRASWPTWLAAAGLALAAVALALPTRASPLLLALAVAAQGPGAWELRAARRALAAAVPLLDQAQRLPVLLREVGGRLQALDHRAAKCHPVTGLPLRERLFEAMRAHAPTAEPRLLAVLRFVDHDRIATFDQAAAQDALAEFARRLAAAVPSHHLVAQVDRDCFALWFEGQADPAAAQAELRALVHPLTQELPSAVATLLPALEIGCALFPEDGTEPGLLLTRALATRCRPSVSARGAVELVPAPTRADARERFVMEQGLAYAIVEEQLTMLFQPLVDLASRRIVGAEALLRWHHPVLGPVSPARFIPMVEATGLSDRYGAWVLNAACREVRRWQDAGHTGLKVAVNLSACQLGDLHLRDKIERTLARHRLAPSVLELELTETAAMTDAARTLHLFGELHDLGVGLALDDFGNGHSSLRYLKNLPFDKLKIDREFVARVHRQADSQAICRALVELGRGLGLSVLAEGVETREELDALARLGCTLFQGFLFSRPVTGPDFMDLLAEPARLPGLASPAHASLAGLRGRLTA